MRFVLVLALLLAAVQPRTATAQDAAPDIDALFAEFDARPLAVSEKRLLQTALAASGDYVGLPDGAWGGMSQRAFEDYAAREFEDTALNLYAATLVVDFLGEIEVNGWDWRYHPELGVSFALPLAVLDPPQVEDDGLRWWSRTGALSILTGRHSPRAAQLWQDEAAAAHAGPAALYSVRRPALMITGGAFRDGRLFYARSDRMAGHWSTVTLVADPDQADMLNLMMSSIHPGRPLPWDLPDGGILTGLVADALAFLDGVEQPGDAPGPQAVSRFGDRPGDGDAPGTGTGFYMGARVIVTALHVVEGCSRITLRDGAPLELLAADAELDVAALSAPEPGPGWLTLSAAPVVRLGQPVHALGFPYYQLAGTSLNLTSGNVSALAGIGDDRRFFSFTAPVQPGNSGGPLIDGAGGVLGLVVARLSDSFIADATGTLPQNVNFALSNVELTEFLRRSGIGLTGGGFGGFDMNAGAPPGVETAVVPVVCH